MILCSLFDFPSVPFQYLLSVTVSSHTLSSLFKGSNVMKSLSRDLCSLLIFYVLKQMIEIMIFTLKHTHCRITITITVTTIM